MLNLSTFTRRILRARASLVVLALALLLSPDLVAIVDALAPQARVFVVGTLYRRHETVPTYDLVALRRIVLAVDPQVLVIDCTPQEVREQVVHASKIEYTHVVFPLMEERKYKVYPAEPDEPLFTEITTAGSAARQAFQQTRPDDAAALQDYVKSAYVLLARHWRSPAEVNDQLTGQVLRAKTALDDRLVYGDEVSAGTRWNRHWTDTILKAAAENPGARVLALTGIENRPWIVDALRESGQVDLVDMPAWLNELR